jgi:sugar O-acyltransferase (sialic acid O-acetyltransferase NeuD family)
MKANCVYVIGSGGHAKVIIRMLQDLGHEVTVALDDSPARWGLAVCGVPIVGPVERITDFDRCPAVIAVGNNAARERIARRYVLEWLTAVHPTAFVDSTVPLGAGTVVLPRAVIQVGSILGSHVIINTATSVDHDCLVEDFVHLAPGVRLAGGVTVRQGVLMGIGAAAIPGTVIGERSTIGAGAVVVSNLPDHVLALGVPARIREPVSPSHSEAGEANVKVPRKRVA